MAGGTAPHAGQAGTFIRELGARSKGGPCRIYTADMRIGVAGERSFAYPDVSGMCVERQFRDETRDVLLNPSFVIEVLSPSTEAYDRGRKLAIYMAVPSIVKIVLVSQDQVRVDKYVATRRHLALRRDRRIARRACVLSRSAARSCSRISSTAWNSRRCCRCGNTVRVPPGIPAKWIVAALRSALMPRL